LLNRSANSAFYGNKKFGFRVQKANQVEGQAGCPKVLIQCVQNLFSGARLGSVSASTIRYTDKWDPARFVSLGAASF
jgi:hypothetical protein